MVSIKVDGDLAESLNGAKDPVEIVDSMGRRLGYFNPSQAVSGEASSEFYAEAMDHLDPDKSQRRLAANEPGLSKEELFRRLDDGRDGQ